LKGGDKGRFKPLFLIYSQFQNILKKRGLEIIETSKGDVFNPEIHEAIEAEESEEDHGKILEIITNGYKLNGKVIRPTKVKVSK
jgi:molecular chaperone GrpE